MHRPCTWEPLGVLQTVTFPLLLKNVLADDRVAPEDLEPYRLSGRAYRDARGAAEHPQQQVTPTAAGNSEYPLRDRLHRDVPLLARNAADRDSLRRSFNRLGEFEACASGLPQTLENDRGTLVVVESELPAAIDRKLKRLPPCLLPGSRHRSDCHKDTEHGHRCHGHSHRLPPSFQKRWRLMIPQKASLVHARQAGSSGKPPARSSSRGAGSARVLTVTIRVASPVTPSGSVITNRAS